MQIRQPAAQSKLREPFDVARAAPVIMILISDHVTIIINCVLTADFFCSEGTLEFYILLIANGLRKRTVT